MMTGPVPLTDEEMEKMERWMDKADLDMRADVAALHREFVLLRVRVEKHTDALREARRRNAMHGVQISVLGDQLQKLKGAAYPLASPPPELECICAEELRVWEHMGIHKWSPWRWDCPKHGRIVAGWDAHRTP